MRKKGYIKNLDWKCYFNFNKFFLSVSYERNGEYNKTTYIINKLLKTEKEVRNFLNN